MSLHTRRAALAVAATGALAVVTVPAAAWAAGYPSWSDVLAARRDVKKKAEQIGRIKAALRQSRAAAERAQQEAERRGTVYQAAVTRVDAASTRLRTIEQQVAADERRAQQATQHAGQLAAQLTRTGGTDPETTLFLSGDSHNAEDFLSKLGRLSKLTEANGAIAAEAESARNAAAATQAQVARAKAQLVGLRNAAKIAYNQAVAASEAANEQVQKQQALQIELEARLKALQATSDATARQFQAGVRARKAAATSAGAGGSVNGGGWAKPAYGPITAGFGPRPDRPAGANFFHHGTDIGAGYGSPIYAAHAGTVTYAGWFGTYGYWIEIDDGDGIQTGYAHIRPGGIFVHVGEHVSAGQNIASVGSTGAATGPHLHFETRINEVAVDAQPFMAARGITLG